MLLSDCKKSAFGLQQGWADFFVQGQIWKLFFIAGQIIQNNKLRQSYNFCEAEKIGLFMLLLTVFDQISGIEKSMLLFLLLKKVQGLQKEVGGPHVDSGPHFKLCYFDWARHLNKRLKVL